MNSFTDWDNELYHHGIKGQKWGIRRFQNEDGSLTVAGESRYLASSSKMEKGLNKLNKRQAKMAARSEEYRQKSIRTKNSEKAKKYSDKADKAAKEVETLDAAQTQIIEKGQKRGFNTYAREVVRGTMSGKKRALRLLGAGALSVAATVALNGGNNADAKELAKACVGSAIGGMAVQALWDYTIGTAKDKRLGTDFKVRKH